MAKNPAFNYVNFTIWMILIFIISVGLLILYNKTVFEKFEENKTEPEPEPKEEKIKEDSALSLPTSRKEDSALDPKEQTIFDKILKNEVSSGDLEKLINAGVVTQNMVEKFLSKLDEKQDSTIEAFCSNGIGSAGCVL